MLKLMSFLTVAALLGAAGPNPDELRREALMAALRSGGLTVVLRHAATDRSYQEDRTRVPPERDKQRNLSPEGERQARLMGTVFTRHGIRFGEVVASPMFRTVETARMAAGEPTLLTMALRVFPATPEQAALVAAAASPGTNRLLVTHHFVIETHVPGIRPGDIGEGEAVVVRPDGKGGVVLLGRITLGDWEALAERGATPAPSPASPEQEAGSGFPDGPAFPDAPVGRLAGKYLRAFNSGNAEWMRLFLDNVMTNEPGRPIEERLATYRRLYEELGPLTLVSVDSIDATSIEFAVRSKKGNLGMVVRSAANAPDRVQSVSFRLPGGGHH